MPRRNASMAAGLALVSLVTLVFELVQIRVFSYALHPLIAYSAIAIAMLGFGLGATALAVRPSLAGHEPPARLAHASVWLAVSMVAVNALFARVSPHVFHPNTMVVSPFWTALTLLPCVLPYLIAGFIVSLVLQLGIGRVGRMYACNLLASAAGCVLVIVLLRDLGAERLVVLSAAGAALAGCVFAGLRAPRRSLAAPVLAVVLLAASPFAPSWLGFPPDVNDLLYVQAARHGQQLVRELSRWDPVGRIDVVRHPDPTIDVTEPVGFRTITNDSGAMALLIRAPGPAGTWGRAIFEQTMYALPYRLVREPEVLVIGVGGGLDIHTALHWNARRVTGVELCGTTLELLNGPYAAYTRWHEQGDRVRLLFADGRSYARSTQERFDVVQLSGVDTFTMSSASAMVTAEDYLYTVDAFEDFLRLLRPQGVLAVTRFGDEAMNLSTIAAAALRRLGAQHPEDQIAAAQAGFASGIVVKREPFSASDVQALRGIEDRQEPTQVRIPHYDESGLRASEPLRLLHPAGRIPDTRYQRFFAAVGQGQEQQVLRELGNPFVPPTDDRPYYMLGTWLASGAQIHPVIATLQLATATIAIASLSLILLPLLAVRRRSREGAATLASVLAYFFSLGAGFMLLEVGLIHRTIVFVGSPGAAVSVVIASILTSSGLGSLVSDRVRWTAARSLVVALAGLLAVGAFYQLGASALFDALFALPTWARGVTASLALAPAGFFAGWFFPVGLRVASSRSEALVPWTIAVNGFASVLGSLATLSLGVSFGFRRVFLISLVGYAVGVMVLLPLALGSARRAARPAAT